MSTSLSESKTTDDYTVRAYKPSDCDGVLALDDAVWGRDRGIDWFNWKYVDNPYLDHVPIFVAVHGGEVVGARPLLAFPMRAEDNVALALQPADTMVHPDHRRQGLFTRMNECAIRRYEEADPAFFFNFPNQYSRPGYLKLGWRSVGDRRTYYRVQHLDSFLSHGSTLPDVLTRVATHVAQGYYRVRESLVRTSEDYTVERHDGIVSAQLASLYEQCVPRRIHALRDETFYEWRFASPVWERATYVATRRGTPIAAVIARTRTTSAGVIVTQFADVVPMGGGEAWIEALAVLFERVLDDHADSDLFAVADSIVPQDLLARYGFISDGARLLARMSDSDCSLVVRPLDDGEQGVDNRRVTREAEWIQTFAERDTT